MRDASVITLKKHGQDSRLATVCSLLEGYKAELAMPRHLEPLTNIDVTILPTWAILACVATPF
jgi:hypothetical protein